MSFLENQGTIGFMTASHLFDVDFMLTPNPGETFAPWAGLIKGERADIHPGTLVHATDGEVNHSALVIREEPWGVVLAVNFEL